MGVKEPKNIKHHGRVYLSITNYFKASSRGAIALVAAIIFPVLLGMIGLGIDVGTWYNAKRSLQVAADAAAIGGVIELSRYPEYTNAQSNATTRATADAVRNGFVNAAPSTITVNWPPLNGPNTGSSTAVEVILTKQAPLYFSKLLFNQIVTITARAVAQTKYLRECITGLGGSSTISTQGNASLNLIGCGMYSNSILPNAVSTQGSAIITAQAIDIVGGYTGSSYFKDTGGNLTPTTGVNPIYDPFATQLATFQAFLTSNPSPVAPAPVTAGGVTTYSPGTYTSNIHLTGGAIVFKPGLYVLNGASLDITGGADVSMGSVNSTPDTYGITDGITLYLQNGGSLNMHGGGAFSIAAPTTGYTKSLTLASDGNSTSNTLNGNSTVNLNGIVYLPNGSIKMDGTSGAGTFDCAQIIATTIQILGNVQNSMTSSCNTDFSKKVIYLAE